MSRQKAKPKMESLKGLSKEERKKKKIEASFDNEDLDGRYEFTKSLGMGAYGAVCMAKRLEDDKTFAIKKVLRVFANESQAKRLLRELALLRKLRACENIVGLEDILPPDDMNKFDSLIFVLEYIDTDLGKLFKSNQYWTQKHVPYILYQILLGLNYMHSAKICHRDLKPANILMNSRCKVRICDFGLARSWIENADKKRPPLHSKGRAVMSNSSKNLLGSKLGVGKSSGGAPKLTLQPMAREPTKHVVTRWYRAPEVILLEQKWDCMAAIDMWAVGCILAEIMQMLKANVPTYSDRRALFPGGSSYPLSPHTAGKSKVHHQDQLQKIFDVVGTPSQDDINKFDSDAVKKYLRLYKSKRGVDFKRRFSGSPAADIDFMVKCLTFNRNKRMTVTEALAHDCVKANRNKDREVTTEPETFNFEDIPMNITELRSAIVDEILLYNPTVAGQFGLEPTKSRRNLQLLPRTLTMEKLDTAVREKTIPEDIVITDSMRNQGIYTNEEAQYDSNWVDENKLDEEEKAMPAQTPAEDYANSVEEAENRTNDEPRDTKDSLPNPKTLKLSNQASSGMPLGQVNSDDSKAAVSNTPVPDSQYGPNTPRDDAVGLPPMNRDITGQEVIDQGTKKKQALNKAATIDEDSAVSPQPGGGQAQNTSTTTSSQPDATGSPEKAPAGCCTLI